VVGGSIIPVASAAQGGCEHSRLHPCCSVTGMRRTQPYEACRQCVGQYLPGPSGWWWTIVIRDRRDRPRLRDSYAKIILRCKSVGVTDPQHLPLGEFDADVQWLVRASSVQMRGHPDVPATDGHRMRQAMINQPSRGAARMRRSVSSMVR
jgi:hypothetical protein